MLSMFQPATKACVLMAAVIACCLPGCGGASDAPQMANATLSLQIDGTPAPAGVQVKISPVGPGQPVILATNESGEVRGPMVVGQNVVSVIPGGAHGGGPAVPGIGKIFETEASPLKVNVEQGGKTLEIIDVGAKQATASGKGGR